MKQTFFYIILASTFIAVGWFANIAWNLPKEVNPIAEIKPRPLEKYEIERLAEKYTGVLPSEINITGTIQEEEDFSSYEFIFEFDPTLTGGGKKKVTGLINIPTGEGPFPLILMLRGYVDQNIYQTGMGSKRSGEFFAKNGYITVAPDFFGYAGSDTEAGDIFESRFQTYTTAMTLVKSLEALKGSPLKVGSSNINVDTNNIFIWAHSNGGQIALTVLEITGAEYPTVLWAPNSAKFPYSILYYLDEAADDGKFLISELSKFMADYDAKKFAFTHYLGRIRAPIQINQGTSDNAIPTAWSDMLAKNLEKSGVKVEYIKYPGADHNMTPGWQNAVENSLTFFKTDFTVK
jgi:uncharacterized protein